MIKYFKVFLSYRYLLGNLISRDIKVKYRRSILGLVWSILNPLLMMLVITTVFSLLFKFNIANFPIYYLTGFLMFSLFSEATTMSMTSVISAAPLIKKVYIPKYLFPLEKTLFAFVNTLFSLIAVIIVMLITKTQFHLTLLLFPIPLIYCLIFSLGISLILSSLTVFFRDMLHLYSVFIAILMYLTPIIYPESILPPKMGIILLVNPLYHFVKYFRDIILEGKLPTIQMNLACLAFAFGSLFVGIIFFKIKQDKFILYI